MSPPAPTRGKTAGDLLLAGWTMLRDACESPGCHAPLMEDRRSGSGEVVCAKCGASYVRAGDSERLARMTPVEPPPPAALPPPSRAAQEALDRSDEAAAAIGSKLLSGWTMLAQPCGACATPLMEEPGEERGAWCLLCRKLVDKDGADVEEEEAQEAEPQAPRQRSLPPVPQRGSTLQGTTGPRRVSSTRQRPFLHFPVVMLLLTCLLYLSLSLSPPQPRPPPHPQPIRPRAHLRLATPWGTHYAAPSTRCVRSWHI